MAPKKNIIEQLIELYNESRLLIPFLALTQSFEPKTLPLDAKIEQLVEAMSELFNQTKTSLSLSSDTKQEWEVCLSILAAGADLEKEVLLEIFHKINRLIKAQHTAHKISKQQIFKSSKSITIEAPAPGDIIQPNILSSYGLDPEVEFKLLYRQYQFIERKYDELIVSLYGSSSSSSSKLHVSNTLKDPHLLTSVAIIEALCTLVFNKIDLDKIKNFLLFEDKMKLLKLRHSLSISTTYIESMQLLSKYAQTLCSVLGWELEPLRSQITLTGHTNEKVTDLWNNNSYSNAPKPTFNPILARYQSLYQQFVNLENTYNKIAQQMNRVKASDKLVTLEPISPNDIKVILSALLGFIRGLDLNRIGEFMEAEQKTILLISQNEILSLPAKIDSPELYEILSKFEEKLAEQFIPFSSSVSFSM